VALIGLYEFDYFDFIWLHISLEEHNRVSVWLVKVVQSLLLENVSLGWSKLVVFPDLSNEVRVWKLNS
jgi:hypothetical protein